MIPLGIITSLGLPIISGGSGTYWVNRITDLNNLPSYSTLSSDSKVDSSGNLTFGYATSNNASVPWAPAIMRVSSTGVISTTKTFTDAALNYGYPLGNYSDNANYYLMSLENTNSAAYLMKLTSAGAASWAKKFSNVIGTIVNYFSKVTPDAYTATNFYWALGNYGSGAAIPETTLCQFSSTGTLNWQRKLSTPQNVADVKVDSSGNIYMVSYYCDASPYFISLVKYNSSGVLQWSRKATISAYVSGYPRIAVTPTSDIVVICSDATSALTGTEIVKFDSSGNVTWAKHIQANANGIRTIAVSSTGDIFASFGSIVHKFDSAGNLLWQRLFKIDGAQAVALEVVKSASALSYIYLITMVTGTDVAVFKYPDDGSIIGRAIEASASHEYSIDYGNSSISAGTLAWSNASFADVAGALTFTSFTPTIATNSPVPSNASQKVIG